MKHIAEEASDLQEHMAKQFRSISKRLNKSHAACELSFGISEFDERTGGVRIDGLTMIYGMADSGKTLLLVYLLNRFAVAAKKPSLLVSCAVPAQTIIERMVCAWGDLDSNKVLKGRFRRQLWPDIGSACARVAEARLITEDNDSKPVSLSLIEDRIEQLRDELSAEGKKLEMVFIDGFDQLADVKPLNNWDYQMTRLHSLAKRHKLAVVLTCRRAHPNAKHATIEPKYDQSSDLYAEYKQHFAYIFLRRIRAKALLKNRCRVRSSGVPFNPLSGRIIPEETKASAGDTIPNLNL